LLTKSVKYVMSRRTFLLNVLAVTENDEFFADHVGGKPRFAQSRQVGLV
jgi:hypothetical protein